MERNVEFKGFEPPERIRPLIDRLTSKLERVASTFPPDLADLRIMIEENEARTLYSISITLDLPGKTLATKEEQHDIQAGIRAAFAEIGRQLEKYKSSLRQEDRWNRPEKRAETVDLEDLLADIPTPIPEDAVELNELRRLANRAIEEMPKQWRRVLLEHDLNDGSVEKIANKLRKPVAEIERSLQSARAQLRRKLVEAGYIESSPKRIA